MRIKLISAALLATGIASAATPVDGWYTSVFGGYTYLPGNVNIFTFDRLHNNSSYKDGYNAGGRVGYQSNPIRYEAEYTYLSANTSGFDVNHHKQRGVRGSATANLIMANLYFDCPEMLPAITPFLGLGIGYGYIQTSLISEGPLKPHFVNEGPFRPTFFKASNNKFAYQGTAGITYNFAENYALNIAYRYVATTNASQFGDNFQAHIASAGAIYRFDYGNYK